VSCGEDQGEAGCLLQPMEVNGGADIHLQSMEDPTPQQAYVPREGSDPMETMNWSRLLAELVTQWRAEPELEQICWQDL